MDDTDKIKGMTYSKVGGSYQLHIEKFADLQSVLDLDEAFWALNCVDVNSLRMDKRFLAFVDADNDGRIRTDEVRRAIEFLLANMKDGKGFEEGSDILMLSAINDATPVGVAMLDSARLILKNLNKPDAATLTLDELRNDKAIRSRSYSNGDGVVTPDQDQPPEVNDRIELIMKTAGSADDVSGVKGINAALIDKFLAECTAYNAWQEQLRKDDGTLLCFGQNTANVYAQYLAVKGDIDNYFLNSETLEFFSEEPDRVAKKDLAADVRAPEEVRAMLEKSVLALPRADRRLDLNDRLNPLRRAQIESFFALPECAKMLEDNRLSVEEWRSFVKKIAPYDAWSKAKPVFAGLYEAVDQEVLSKITAEDPVIVQLKECCAKDLNAGTALAGMDVLHKFMLFQRYLKELLNNFVSLASLFDLAADSPLQAGKLVMDGRHFTLAVPVKDLAEHKRIVTMSNICVLYIELSPTASVKPPWQTLAVAVSSGNMRNLFVGKRGLFFAAGGGIFDAKVTAFVEQPVSISEALKNPFYRFGAFVGEQISKFFNSKAAGAQKELGAQLSSGKVPPVPAAGNNGGNASMILMGGGIGIAALGSSVAFITKQLQTVSIWDILSVLLGIILIFGGPVVAVSLVKLYRRNLSRFLEATGCAVNRRMRMSRAMGNIFTFSPEMPAGKKIRSSFVPRRVAGAWGAQLLIVLVVLLIIGACAGVWYMRGRERARAAAAAAAAAKTAETTAKEPAQKKCAAPAKQAAPVKKECPAPAKKAAPAPAPAKKADTAPVKKADTAPAKPAAPAPAPAKKADAASAPAKPAAPAPTPAVKK